MRRMLLIKSADTASKAEMTLMGIFEELDVEAVEEEFDLVSLVDARNTDLLMIDAGSAAERFIEPVRALRQSGNLVPVLFLNDEHTDAVVFRAAECGANGVLCRDAGREQLQLAVKAVTSGYSYFPLKMCKLLDRTGIHCPAELHRTLSARETQILKCLKEGKTKAMIALQLGISVKTVNTFISRMNKKLGFGSQRELTAYAGNR